MAINQIDNKRNLIFISHANPADNDFTAWLGSRLSSMGYDVWADLSDLKGGSKHWQEIENKIREDAVKVLVVTTHASREAEGVENEINIAKGIEKELLLKDFIIQLKVDDLPYTRLPPALNNRLAISFNKNWWNGLQMLVKQFDDEGISRNESCSSSVQLFSSVVGDKSDSVVGIDEPAITSWLPINLPTDLYIYHFPKSAKVTVDKLSGVEIPAYSFKNTVITFAVPDTISYALGLPVSDIRSTKTSVNDWLHITSLTEFSIQRTDRRRTFSGLLNTAWEMKLIQEGLARYQLSNESAFFFPSKDKSPVKQRYVDPLGRTTRPITLVGNSPKYSALWHASLSSRVSMYPMPHYSVKLHVAFTDDGETPIADGAKAFKLRKSFCKSFWNDRWRRILLSFFTRLMDDGNQISIGTGGEESIKVDAPFQLNVPYSIESDLAIQIEDEQDDDVIVVEDDDVGVEFGDDDED